MRIKKSIKNSFIGLVSLIILFIPNLLIRKVFMNKLGSDMLGLISLYTNIISWLSIIELGIGSTIVFSLYKPFYKNDYEKINIYLSYYSKFYKKIGFCVLFMGILISVFIQYFIDYTDINIDIARIGMVLFTINTFLSYIFSHKLCLLNVSQQSYKITIFNTISRLIIFILQYIMLNNNPSFLMYILIQIIINFIYYICINIYIYKLYPWIKYENEKLDLEEAEELSRNVKAMFVHKLASLIVLNTDNIIISKFLGLSTLAKYTNYQIVIIAIQSIIRTIMNGMSASIGNLIAESNELKSYQVHRKIFFINFWLTSNMIIVLYNTLNQFIVLWVGRENMIDNFTFCILLMNLYFSSMRSSVELFQSGSGNFYQDRYAPVLESIINLIMSLILVKKIGLVGVFLGTLLSNFFIISWTKPYVVYKYVFDRSVLDYFKMYYKYLFIFIIPFISSSVISDFIKYNYNLFSFTLNCFINLIIVNIFYVTIFYKDDEFKYILNIIKLLKK